jgi:energy-converting hydrogenase Eha subunit C
MPSLLTLLTAQQVSGIVRHAVTFFGGILAAKGYFDGAMMDALASAVATIGGIIWSAMAKPSAPAVTDTKAQ